MSVRVCALTHRRGKVNRAGGKEERHEGAHVGAHVVLPMLSLLDVFCARRVQHLSEPAPPSCWREPPSWELGLAAAGGWGGSTQDPVGSQGVTGRVVAAACRDLSAQDPPRGAAGGGLCPEGSPRPLHPGSAPGLRPATQPSQLRAGSHPPAGFGTVFDLFLSLGHPVAQEERFLLICFLTPL